MCEQLWHKKMSETDFLKSVAEGKTIEGIQQEFGYQRRQPVLVMAQRLSIYDLLKFKEPNPTGGHLREFDRDEIFKAVQEGLSYEEIQKKFGCGKTTVKRALKENNAHIKNPKQRILYIDFTEDEFQVLYGTLLGDATLDNRSKNVKGSFTHCKEQAELVAYKQYYLSRFTNPVKTLIKKDYRYNPPKEYLNCYCYIKASTALNALYPKVYQNKIKYVDKDLLYRLNGLGLAIWYMDDGSRDDYGYILCTDSFSDSDLQLIQAFFKEKFDINTSIRKNKEIYIKADSKQKFRDLVEPYMIESMMYKL